VEIEVEVTRTETVVFAIEDGGSGSGTDGVFDVKVGVFLRALRYWMHSPKNLVAREKVALKDWRFLDHDTQTCTMFKHPDGTYRTPEEPEGPCDCLRLNLERCEKGSLNRRRVT